jgi:Leucine-rich repeat (LRR) protein
MAPKMHRFPSMAREIGSFLSPRNLVRCTKQLCSKGVTFVEAPEPAPTVAKMDLCELISRSSGKRESSTAKPDARAAAIVAHEVFARIQLYLTRCPNIKQLDLVVDERDKFANLVPIFRLVEEQLHTTQSMLHVAVRWYVHTDTVEAAVVYRPLHFLNLRNSKQVKDVTGLTSCESLHELNLSNCPGLTDITALGSCRSLRRLHLGRTNVTDLSALASCESLRRLDLGSTDVSDLSALASCELLDHLSLNRCMYVVDVSALGACRSLRTLNLRATNVHDVSALVKCDKLYALNLQCAKVTDVSALSAFQSLRLLNLASSGVTDLSPLLACKALTPLLACKSLISVQLVNSEMFGSPEQQLGRYSARTRVLLDTINSRETGSTRSELFRGLYWMH